MNGINAQVRTSNHIVITIANQAIAIVQSARFQVDFALSDQAGIGDNLVVEYVPGIARATASLSGVVKANKNLLAAGILPSQSMREILYNNVWDVGVYTTTPGSNTPGALLLKAISCTPSNVSVSIDTGQALKYDVGLNCLDLAGTLL